MKSLPVLFVEQKIKPLMEEKVLPAVAKGWEHADHFFHPRPPAAGSLDEKLREVTTRSKVVIIGCLGTLLLWAAFAPLAGAVSAAGLVAPQSSRKVVQHLEGGIIREILVKDGKSVKAGEALLIMDSTQARANFETWRGHTMRLEVQRTRLTALQRDEDLVFSEEVKELSSKDSDFSKFVSTQVEVFEKTRAAQRARTSALKQQIESLRKQDQGLLAQIAGRQEQLKLTEAELADQNFLLKRDLARRPQLLAIQRRRAELQSDMLVMESSRAKLASDISEKELTIANQEATFANEISEQLSKVSADLAQAEEKMKASADILRRTTVEAPEAGVVVDLRFKTPGGVIAPGGAVLDLVPPNDELVIVAKASAQDGPHIHIGQEAQVTFTSFSQRTVPVFKSRVVRVSADNLIDPVSRQPYAEVVVAIERDQIARMSKNIVIQPGMPADVSIKTRDRSALDYLLDPLTKSIGRSMREL